jgi:hypothetical protein
MYYVRYISWRTCIAVNSHYILNLIEKRDILRRTKKEKEETRLSRMGYFLVKSLFLFQELGR